MAQWGPLQILAHDQRVRSANFVFALTFLSILAFERFTSIWWTVLQVLCIVTATSLIVRRQYYAYAAQAFVLGFIAGYSVAFVLFAKHVGNLPLFACYTAVFCFFHFSEFLFTALTNIENLKVDSFLLNHSIEYWVAAFVSWFEFGVESLLMPWVKVYWISAAGVLICVIGEAVRKTGMWHAGTAFTHLIAYRKQKEHTLVTNGIYAFVRHPGYLGWFLWSVGTQIILCNPFCVVAYAVVTYRFFDDRIYEEERYLINFFGQRYLDYRQRVHSGIPGVNGFTIASSPIRQ